MLDSSDQQKKKLHSEQAADDIRADELVKVTQREAKDSERDKLRDIPVTNRNYWRFRGEDRKPLPRGIKWGIAGLIVVFVAGFAISYYALKGQVDATIASRVGMLQAGVQDLQNLDPQDAAQEFSSLNGSSSISGLFGSFISLFQRGGTIQSFTDLSDQLATLSTDLGSVENDAFTAVAPVASTTPASGTSTSAAGNASTTAFSADLENIRTTLGAIDNDTNRLSTEADYLNDSLAGSGESYLALKTQVESAEHFLDAFIPWLTATSTTHHVLVLFENPSEMRPGGGFIGSYADVSVSGGAITGVAVHDVADVDSAFTKHIVPPVPLQLEETAWRPADANWFFDYPTSASETIGLFDQSELYANTSTTFDGAIAVTPQILADLLSATGPITLPGATPKAASTTFTAANLVPQIQAIVQAGQAKTSGGDATYPKAIIGQLYQSVFGDIASSTQTEKAQIMQMAFNWIANKDVMAYFNIPGFESFVKSYGAAGDEYQLSQNFNGDYLAVVNTDVNSDKSEHVIAQTVNYQATIGDDGTLTDHLVIDRTHDGNGSPYWWYRTTNQDYMQIVVPAGTSVENENGGIVKSVSAPINYLKNGYSTDPFLQAIVTGTLASFAYPKMSTLAAGDKDVLSLWSRVYAGDTSEEVFDYSHNLFIAPADGVQYNFVIERQAGADGEYKVEIDAPLGYVFAENGLASFMYDSTSTPGRLIFTLTLQKLQD